MTPTEPGKNAIGMNTADSTSVMPMIAPVICPIALRVASLGRQAFLGHDALDVLDHDDRVVDQDADRQHHGEHGQHVDRKAGAQHHRAGAQQRHRHDDASE